MPKTGRRDGIGASCAEQWSNPPLQMRFVLSPLVAITAALMASPSAQAQAPLFTWDGNLGTSGVIDNAAGTWNLTDLRWYDGAAYQTWSGSAIAQFGSTTTNAGAAITVNEAISLSGLNFLPISANLPSANLAYSFIGSGSLNFATGSVLSISSGASNGSSGFVQVNVPLAGHNLVMNKPEGTLLGYINLNVANPNLTGTLTLKSSADVTGGIYLTVNPTRFAGLERMVVEPGSVASTSGAGNFALPMTIAGIGGAQWGAIRVGTSGTNFTGGITLSGDARFHTHINVLNAVISSPITETPGSSKTFTRTAYSPVLTTSVLATTYSAANTYTGGTVLGRLTSLTNTSETVATEGGLNILDFTAASAPDNNIFYHGTTPGALTIIGGQVIPTVLRMNGAASESNSQSFGGLNVQQGATAIEVFSGTGGSASLALGEVVRSDLSALAIRGPAAGSITASVGGSGNAFIGPWATYTSADGKTSTWAGLTDGAVGHFTGTTEHATGVPLAENPTAHLRLSPLSTGEVSLAAPLTSIATLSMTDSTADRMLNIGGTNTLRLGETGGFQVVNGARHLTVGQPGDGSSLTAGAADNAAGQVILTNLSGSSALTVNSGIKNNGTGIVSLMINGSGRTILTGASSFTGTVAVHSGILEIRNNTSLGAAGSSITKVMTGASLNLAGDITVAENIQANGQGIALDGAIRNLSGTNTLSSVLRLQGAARIASDSGTLILSGITAQNSGQGLTFSGNGNIDLRGNLALATGTVTKEGRGTLTLNGTNTATGTTTVTNGTLSLNFAGTTAPAANMLYTGVTAAALSLSNSSTLILTGKSGATNSQALTTVTLGTAGSYRISAQQNGATNLSLNFTTITRPAAAVMRFDLPTTGAITTTTGSNNTLLTGTGGVAYATVGTSDWAATATSATASRNIVGLSSISGYTASTATALEGNADIAASVTTTTLSANTSLSSLRFNQPQATTITQDVTGRILTTGGILVTPEVGANDVTIAASTLRAPTSAADLVIIQNNTQGLLKITGKISNNAGGTTTGLTKAGPGTLLLEYAAGYLAGDYSGATRILEGTLQLASSTGSTIVYPVYHSGIFTLGSGAASGRLVLGSGTVPITQYGGLRAEGYGSGNALVGGSSNYSTFLTYATGTHDFRNGYIGGPGLHEDNLNLTISIGTTQLGPENTFKGKTILSRDTVEVTRLADVGLPSSLGTGNANASAAIIEMTSLSTSAVNIAAVSTLRYIGSTDSVTNRPVSITNSDVIRDVLSVTANIENTGTGTVKFTSPFTAGGSNLAPRYLRLGGSNKGANEIVSIGNTLPASGAPGVVLEKYGSGTWILTGGCTHTGGTYVNEGTLLAGNTVGSATGLGSVFVQPGATLGGTGRISPEADQYITINGGTLSVGNNTLATPAAGRLEISMSGSSAMLMEGTSFFDLDLFSGAGLGLDQSGNANAADLLVVTNTLSLGTGTTLRVGNPLQMTGFAHGDTWKLFDWSGLVEPVYGTFAQADLPSLSPGLMWDLSNLYTQGTLMVTLVPEPSRPMLLVLAGGLWLARRRRAPEAERITSNKSPAEPARG